MTGAVWSSATVALYAASRALHRRWPGVLLSPLVVVPVALAAVLLSLHVPYATYMRGGGPLVDVLGPTTVAFAIPLYRNRALLRRHAIELAVAVATGSIVAVGSSIALAQRLHLGDAVTCSLAPRSITTPFAMIVAGALGGVPALAAVFVIVTAVVGLVVGELLVRHLPLRSPIARGALFGMGAHGAGTAKAMELGMVEGTIAGLVMILAGLAALAATPVIRIALRIL